MSYVKQILRIHFNIIFVEASPFDKIWGIGLTENDELADDEKSNIHTLVARGDINLLRYLQQGVQEQ